MPKHATCFPVRSILAAVLLLAGLTGCMKWSTMKLKEPLEAILSEKPQKRLRVTTLQDGTFELKEPYVHGDSLYGYADVKARMMDPDGLCAIPLTEVTRVDHRAVNGPLVALGVVGGGVVVAAIVAASTFEPFGPTSP